MDCEYCQAVKVKCKQHPQTQIGYIYCKKYCPYNSRLACNKCLKEYKTQDGFEEVREVLKDPRVILSVKGQADYGIYNILNTFFDLIEQDPEEFIKLFKKDIQMQIDKLEQDLKQRIEKYTQFRAEIAQVQKQFNEDFGQAKFKNIFKEVLIVEGYHYGSERIKLEDSFQSYILQFNDQNNQKFKEASDKIMKIDKELKLNLKIEPKLLNEFQIDFQYNTKNSIQFLNDQLANLGIIKKYSNICDQLYFEDELIKRITKNKNTVPKVTLLFKASVHGMNGQSFWTRCSNQGPTITICKSKNGYVFGGYSPCKWVPGNGSWQKDESKSSFLFSYTRKEIYPILLVDNAIYCHNGYGPTFGGGFNLHIAADFQSGGSNMTGQYYSNEFYKIENQQTHLMGSETPQLVEMEVFAIE